MQFFFWNYILLKVIRPRDVNDRAQMSKMGIAGSLPGIKISIYQYTLEFFQVLFTKTAVGVKPGFTIWDFGQMVLPFLGLFSSSVTWR